MPNNNIQNIYELSIYDTNFSDKIKSKLNNVNYNKISITNKKFNTPIIDIIKEAQEINSKLEIIPYYSLKYHQNKSLELTSQEFLQQLQEFYKLNIQEVLIISGVPKPKYHSLQVLQYLASIYNSQSLPRIAVAYNPFLTGIDSELENINLRDKIKTGIISSVYLQIGIDIPIIQKAVQNLRNLQSNLNIYLSLINPSPARLSQLKYKPWKGVYLPEEYLSSTQIATQINQSIYKLALEMNLGIIQGD
jgi:hypothetical protein